MLFGTPSLLSFQFLYLYLYKNDALLVTLLLNVKDIDFLCGYRERVCLFFKVIFQIMYTITRYFYYMCINTLLCTKHWDTGITSCSVYAAYARAHIQCSNLLPMYAVHVHNIHRYVFSDHMQKNRFWFQLLYRNKQTANCFMYDRVVGLSVR